jgi:hypothetical protein
VGAGLPCSLVALTGRATDAYLVAATCCAVCAAIVAGVQPRPVERASEPLTFRSVTAGVRLVWSTRLILTTITPDLMAVLVGEVTALLPTYARDILHVGPNGLGWLPSAPAIGGPLSWRSS